MTHYIGFDPEKLDDNNCFLSEELLIPWCNHTDTIRVNMVDSHLIQSIVLNNPELPLIATGFERQVGKYSSSYKLAKSDLVLQKVIKKHKRRRVYILTDPETCTVYIADIPSCRNITEYYGYKIIDLLKTKKEGEYVKKDEAIFSCPSYDKHFNFSYGVNLNAIFLAYKGLTYEDAIVISESAAKKMETTTVKEIKVTLNTNDILVNLYGNQNHYKGFPKVGEKIQDGILCARRRVIHESLLHDFSTERMQSIEPNLDDIFYAEGTVVDIEIFSNADANDLKKNDSYQILETLAKNVDFYGDIEKTVDSFLEGGYTLSEDASFIYKRATEMVNPEVSFCTDNAKTDFDNIIITFVVECRRSLKPGDKITGRYGNKGTISAILPDDQMPISEDGTIPDIILNPLGVCNRLNPPQLFEQEINFIGQEIANKIQKTSQLTTKENLYVRFLELTSPDQAEYMKAKLKIMKIATKKNFFKSLANEGIHLIIPPFFGNPDFMNVTDLYKEFKIDTKKFYDRSVDPDKVAPLGNIGRGLICGKMYFIRLKHDSLSKFSARSAGYLSLSSIPSKNNRQFKEKKALYSNTAVRFGEMELVNLMVLQNVEEVVRLLSLYSSNSTDRQNLAEKLLGLNQGKNDSIFSLQKIERTSKVPSQPKEMLNAYLECMGMRLEE